MVKRDLLVGYVKLGMSYWVVGFFEELFVYFGKVEKLIKEIKSVGVFFGIID